MHSVSRVYAQAIVQLAERRALALPGALLAEVGRAERVPLATQDALWEAYCAAGRDPLAGLRVGLALQAGHLDSAGLQLAACDTLGDALAELASVAPAIGEGGSFELERAGELVQLCYRPQLAVRARERVEAVLAGALMLARWASGGRFVAQGLWLAHAPLAPLRDYQALIDVPLHFGAGRDSLGLAAADLELPLVAANAALREHLRARTAHTLAALDGPGLAQRVRALLLAHPAWSRERMASELGMSGRHLLRRLSGEGASFMDLRDAVLHELACQRLAGPQRVAEIADALGFADEGGFVRAFRRWQGTTPTRHRAASGRALPD